MSLRSQLQTAGFRIREWTNYSDTVIQNYERMLSAPPNKLTNRLVFGDDAPERQRNAQRKLIERRIIYWMITAGSVLSHSRFTGQVLAFPLSFT